MKKIIAITMFIASIGSAMFAQTTCVYFDFNSDKISTNYNNQIKALVSGNDQPIDLFTYTRIEENTANNIFLNKRRAELVTKCIKQFNNKVVIKTTNYNISKSNSPADSLNRCVDIFIKDRANPASYIAPKETQEFVIDNTKDTTIIGNEGTKIFIPANSFVLANAKSASNSVYKIQLQEYYKLSDMIMARLNTTLNGQLFSTGGILNIKVTNNNQECIITPQKAIGIAFKNITNKDPKQIYFGTLKQNILNWSLSQKNIIEEREEVFVVVEKSAIFRGGDINSFREYIQSEIKKQYPNIENNNQVKVIVQFAVNPTGDIDDVEVVRGVRPSIDNYVKNMIKASPKWEPASQSRKFVKQQFTIPIYIDLNCKIDSSVNESVKEIPTLSTLPKLFFRINKIGWLNCDRLLTTINKTKLAVDLNINLETPYLIIKRLNTILPATVNVNDVNAFVFNNVPDNENVTVFSLKIVNNEYFLAYNSTNTRLKKIKLDFKKVDAAELKRVLDDLDKL